MREKAILGLIAVMLGMGVLVDFASTVLSFVADLLFALGVIGGGWLVMRLNRTRVQDLQQQVAQLQAENQRLRTASSVPLPPWPRDDPIQNPFGGAHARSPRA